MKRERRETEASKQASKDKKVEREGVRGRGGGPPGDGGRNEVKDRGFRH